MVLLTVGRVVAFVGTFGTGLVLARVFDQAMYGTYKQLFFLYATFAAIGQLGMAESLLYFLPSARDRGGRYVLTGLLVLAGSGLACLILFGLAGPLLGRWLGNPMLSRLSGLLGVYVLLTLPATMLEIVMTARKHHGRAGVAYGLSDLARAVALVVPAVVTRRLEWLIAGGVVFSAIRLGVTLLYLSQEYKDELRPDGAVLRKQLAYALPFQLGVALWILVLNLHYFLVASMVDAATFAIYAVGCLQIPIVELLFTPAKNVLIVRMREAIMARRPDAALLSWYDTTRRLALVFFPLVGLLLVTARDLIPFLFTERYAASVPIFMVWSAIILIAAVQADVVLAVYGDTRAMAVASGFQVLLIAVLVPSLFRPLGLVGAVGGTILAIGIGKTLVLLRAKRLMGLTLVQMLPWRNLGEILGAATISAVVAHTVKVHLPVGPLLLLAVTSSVYSATYLGALLLFRLLNFETALPAIVPQGNLGE